MRSHRSRLFFLLISFISYLLSHVYSKPSEVCVSQGGRFPSFANEGKPPSKAKKGPRDLTFCRVFRKKTCCDVTQTHPALLSIRRLASSGEASQECLQLWEALECSICDPRVGVQRGPPRICASFCDRVYDACSSAYFSVDAKTQVLAPCGVGEFVCGRALEWVSNGTDLCRVAGFQVKSFGELKEASKSCYDGKGSIDDYTANFEFSRIEEKIGILNDFKQWLDETPFNDKVSWAVGGLVLTAGLVFGRCCCCGRRNLTRRQKQPAGRKLGIRNN